MTTELLFSFATSHDCLALADLHYRSHTLVYRDFFSDAWAARCDLKQYASAWQHDLNNEPENEQTWLARQADELVGSITVGEIADDDHLHQIIKVKGISKIKIACIRSIHVDSDMMGQGIGKALMEKALSEMKDCMIATLLVHKENMRAIRFYEKYGWQANMPFYKPMKEDDDLRYWFIL